MKNKPFQKRLGFAWSGIRATWRSEASFRTQICGAATGLVLFAAIQARPVWWALYALSAAAVLSTELMNTALEHVIDRLHPDMHPSIKHAKDCAAAAVLVFSLASLLVAGCALFERFQ